MKYKLMNLFEVEGEGLSFYVATGSPRFDYVANFVEKKNAVTAEAVRYLGPVEVIVDQTNPDKLEQEQVGKIEEPGENESV